MPYNDPSHDAVAAACDEIESRLDGQMPAARDSGQAIAALEQVLKAGADQVSILLQANAGGGAWNEQLVTLRAVTADYASRVLLGLLSASASGAILMSPTSGRLASMIAMSASDGMQTGHVEMLGEHPDETLAEQFAVPLMLSGARAGRARSQDELVHGSLDVLRAAARLMATIDERPQLRRD